MLTRYKNVVLCDEKEEKIVKVIYAKLQIIKWPNTENKTKQNKINLLQSRFNLVLLRLAIKNSKQICDMMEPHELLD